MISLKNMGSLRLERSPYPLYNATLSIAPDFGIYHVGSSQNLSVVVDPGDEPVNAIEMTLTYAPEVMHVDDIDTESSPCSMVVDQSIDDEHGTLTFRCVIFDAQMYQDPFAVVVLHVTFVGEGNSDVHFVNEATSVLANDGLGTDVLRYAEDASYKSAWFTLDDSDSVDARSFVMFSPSHPNPSRWYPADQIQMIWIDAVPGRAYRYTLDEYPSVSVLDAPLSYAQRATFSVVEDGAYYFHLQAAEGGPIATYPIHVDMTAPRISEFLASSDVVTAGDVVRFSFGGSDASSGVQRNFYVDLGSGLLLPVSQTMYLPFLQEGDQTIRLRIYDNAGNSTEQEKTIHVRSK